MKDKPTFQVAYNESAGMVSISFDENDWFEDDFHYFKSQLAKRLTYYLNQSMTEKVVAAMKYETSCLLHKCKLYMGKWYLPQSGDL